MWPFDYLDMKEVAIVCRLVAEWKCDKAFDCNQQATSDILPSLIDATRLESTFMHKWPLSKILVLRQIQNLPEGAIPELAALYWFGRGDSSLRSTTAHARSCSGLDLSYYLANKTDLDTFLIKGEMRLQNIREGLTREQRVL
ncbi:MAG: hypothetical protein Q7T36_10860 [Fluviicoccus sp.]|uniref:hypothetical protein n=1 Tax=Fluviicoccus sp. TaxID=2003552 RepID=UPI00271835BE|nr:hypothetical protein [Fluviicoccus sp.]MDO8330956.1 hypothetical protein [Fluviicoccus sp.]